MITIWKSKPNGLVRTAILERDCWIQVTDPTELERDTLQREYNIPEDIIQDSLDIDERPRSEREEGNHYIIARIPVYDESAKVNYYTIPLGIVLVDGLIITICRQQTDLLQSVQQKQVFSRALPNMNVFLLRLFLQITSLYLLYLKEINKHTSVIESELQQSVRNTELIRLLRFEKSLVFFTTSLRGNELLFEKLTKTLFRQLSEDEQELLEDVITERRQAIEMTNIYSNILSGLMDAFASVISNNLNVVMKRLTLISIILVIPTFFASLYGMNVDLPFQAHPFAFFGVLGVSVIAAAITAIIFTRKNFFKSSM